MALAQPEPNEENHNVDDFADFYYGDDDESIVAESVAEPDEDELNDLSAVYQDDDDSDLPSTHLLDENNGLNAS